jgi:hypothetical protein
VPQFLFRSISLSLLLHGLLLGLLLFLFASRRESKPPPALYVDLPPSPGGEAGEGAATNQTVAGGSEAKRPRARPAKAAPFRWKTQPFAWEEGGGAGAVAGPGHGDAPPRKGRGAEVSALADGMDLAAETKFYPLADRIWHRINTHVQYPPDFIEDNQQGTVLLHITVHPDGRFTGNFLEIEDDNAFLRTYVMAMVAYALREPLERMPRTELKEIALALRFRFQLKLPDEFRDPRPEAHYKNTLQFDRVAFTEPKAIKDARQFIVNHMPPIIPVPGGFIIDFVQLYHQLQEKQDRDPRWKRGFRMEMDQELWKSLIHNQGTGNGT